MQQIIYPQYFIEKIKELLYYEFVDSVAQLVECKFAELEVVGSNPAGITKIANLEGIIKEVETSIPLEVEIEFIYRNLDNHSFA